MPFFIKPKVSSVNRGNKRKKQKKKQPPQQPKKPSEDISSDEDLLENGEDKTEEVYSDDEEHETAQEKKIRLAKVYLKEIEKEEQRRLEEKSDEDGRLSSDVISRRLKQDYLKQTGRFKTFIADQYTGVDLQGVSVLKNRDHRGSVTCLCLTSDDKFLFSGSKDGGVVKWSLETNKRVGSVPYTREQESELFNGHSKVILSMALSSDDQFLVVGDETKDIQIWNPKDLKHMKTLKGHQNSVTGVVFKKNSHILYSCSKDRSVRVWSLDEMAFVETLFGHQSPIMSIDAMSRERALTAGGMDNTIRLWKIPEESQLIFNGHSGSIDTVCFINEEHFVSGGDDGQICVWSVMKKKPLCSVKEAHGVSAQNGQALWVTAVASLKNTDLVASGSNCGHVKLWRLGQSYRTIEFCFDVAICGFVNCLAFSGNGDRIVVAVGREYKFGRWDIVKQAKNSIVVAPLLKAAAAE